MTYYSLLFKCLQAFMTFLNMLILPHNSAIRERKRSLMYFANSVVVKVQQNLILINMPSKIFTIMSGFSGKKNMFMMRVKKRVHFRKNSFKNGNQSCTYCMSRRALIPESHKLLVSSM